MPDAHPDVVKATAVTIPAGGTATHVLDDHCRGIIGINGTANTGSIEFTSGGGSLHYPITVFTPLHIRDIGLRGKTIYITGTAADVPVVFELIGQGEVAH